LLEDKAASVGGLICFELSRTLRSDHGRVAPALRLSEELPVDSAEYHDDTDVECQPSPKSVPQEREIDSDDKGHHSHDVQHKTQLSAHLELFCSIRGTLGRLLFLSMEWRPLRVCEHNRYHDLMAFERLPYREPGDEAKDDNF
jgi:hypothetical protein